MKRLLFVLFSLMLPVFVYTQNVSVYPNLGHTADLGAFAYNPDQNILASISTVERFIKIWDLENARELRTLTVDVSRLYSLIWNKDYMVLVCGTWTGEILFIDFQSGAELRRWKAHRGSVNSLCLSSDGSEILSASFDGTVKKWDSATGREIAVFTDFGGSINRAVFSADGRSFVIACSNGAIKKCDAINGGELLSIPAHTGPVHSITCNSDASLIVSGGFDGLVKLWENGALTRGINAHKGAITALAFSPDYTRIASCSTDGTVKEWNIFNGNKLNEFAGHERIITALQYKNNSRIFSSSFDNSIKEWDTFSAEPVNVFTGYGSYSQTLVFSGDDKYIISGHGNGITYRDSIVRIWDAKTGAMVNSLEGHKRYINSIDVNAETGKIATGSADCTVRVWDMNNNTCDYVLEEHTMDVTDISFSPDGARLASASMDNTVKIWDIKTGKKIKEYTVEHERITNVKWRPDGRQIAAAAASKVYLWDVDSPSGELIIENNYFSINKIAYSPDSSRLAFGGYNNTISIWDTGSGKNIFSIDKDKDATYKTPIKAVQFSPDGKYIVSAGGDDFSDHNDNSIKIWDAESGNLLASMEGHDNFINALAFSKDGSRVVSSSYDSTIRIWELLKDERTGELKGDECVKMIGFTNGEWISITPEGFYTASPDGANYLNVRIGGKVYGMNQYREIFNKPNMVTARLSGRDLARFGVTANIQDAGKNIPPSIEILSETLSEDKDSVLLFISVNGENSDIRKIEFYANDNLLGDDVLKVFSDSGNIKLESASLSVSGGARRLVFRIPIPLTREFNRIKIIARNSLNADGEKTIEVTGKPQIGPPNLWILAIGINGYPEKPNIFNPLNGAVNDAHEFVNFFKTQAGEGKPYKSVNYRIISDESGILPTKENIIKNLDFLKNSGSNDIVMVFIACHGLNDEDNNFYFIPRDFTSNPDGSVPFDKAAVSSNPLKDALWASRGMKILFIDACHSGNFEGSNMTANNDRLVSELSKESIIILTASKGSQESQEMWNVPHGIFTFSLLEGLRGKAANPKIKEITFMDLWTYVKVTVPSLAKRRPQNPQFRLPTGLMDDPVIAMQD